MKSTERQFLARFTQKFKKKFPGAFIYKIPDTKGLGGMRPFDMLILINGETICLEAKRSEKDKITPYQEHNLKLAESNGATGIVLNPENEKVVFQHMEKAWQKKKA